MNASSQRSWRDIAQEALQSLAVLAILAALVGVSFHYFAAALHTLGWHPPLWKMAGTWYAVGVACSLFWPVWYWQGMRGHWRAYWMHGAVLALAGPLALLLGFPL